MGLLNNATVNAAFKMAQDVLSVIIPIVTMLLLHAIYQEVKRQNKWWKNDDEIDSIGK